MEIDGHIVGDEKRNEIWAEIHPTDLGSLSVLLRAPIIKDGKRKKSYVIQPIGDKVWIIYYINGTPW